MITAQLSGSGFHASILVHWIDPPLEMLVIGREKLLLDLITHDLLATEQLRAQTANQMSEKTTSAFIWR